MRTATINLYKFAELSETAKKRALIKFDDINFKWGDWWDDVYEDADRAGLVITGFDIDRGNYCEGKFKEDAIFTAYTILEDHGETTATHQLAAEFLPARDKIVDSYTAEDKEDPEKVENLDNELNEIETRFLRNLLKEYKKMLSDDYDHRSSEEAITESIKANDYEFDETGEPFFFN